MAEDRLPRLIASLLEKTRKDDIVWHKTKGGGYRTDIASRPIVVSKESSDELLFGMTAWTGAQKRQLWLRLYDKEGQVLETIGEEEVKRTFYQGENGLEMLRELHERARRSALGIDKIIDEVISELEDETR